MSYWLQAALHGFVSDQICWRIDLHIAQVNGKQGPATLAKKKEENFDQIYADNLLWRSGVLINRKKYKNIFSQKEENLQKLETCLRISTTHVNKNLIHLVT